MRPPKKPHMVKHILPRCYDVYGCLVIRGVPARGVIRLSLSPLNHDQKSRKLQPLGKISAIFWKRGRKPRHVSGSRAVLAVAQVVGSFCERLARSNPE